MDIFYCKQQLKVFFYAVFFAALAACTTVREEPKLSSPTTSDNVTHTSDTERAAIRLQLGISYLQQDQTTTALKELNNAIAIEPNMVDAYAVRALVYMQMNDIKLAEQDFLKVSDLAPNNPDYKNNYAWFLCMNGREKQAMDMFNQVISDRTYTQPVKAFNNAGLCSLKMKNDVLAESYFMQSIRLDANNPTTNLNLARLSYKKQDWTHAEFYINRIVKSEEVTPEILWLAIKVSNKLKDKNSESSLAIQLQRRFPDSAEHGLLQRSAFDE